MGKTPKKKKNKNNNHDDQHTCDSSTEPEMMQATTERDIIPDSDCDENLVLSPKRDELNRTTVEAEVHHSNMSQLSQVMKQQNQKMKDYINDRKKYYKNNDNSEQIPCNQEIFMNQQVQVYTASGEPTISNQQNINDEITMEDIETETVEDNSGPKKRIYNELEEIAFPELGAIPRTKRFHHNRHTNEEVNYELSYRPRPTPMKK